MFLENVFFLNVGAYLILWEKYGITSIRKSDWKIYQNLTIFPFARLWKDWVVIVLCPDSQNFY